MYDIIYVLQERAGVSVRRGARGGRDGVRGHGAPGPDEASGPGRHLHQAALLDPHTLQQVCVHGRRHPGGGRTTFTTHSTAIHSSARMLYSIISIFKR